MGIWDIYAATFRHPSNELVAAALNRLACDRSDDVLDDPMEYAAAQPSQSIELFKHVETPWKMWPSQQKWRIIKNGDLAGWPIGFSIDPLEKTN